MSAAAGKTACQNTGDKRDLGVARVDRESPARKAGLAARDILISFDGQSVNDLDALQWKIARIEEPTKVRLIFLRNRESRDVETQIELDPQK